MKHGFPTASRVAHLIERAAGAARFRGKTGKGKLSTEALALILAHPGELFLPMKHALRCLGGWDAIPCRAAHTKDAVAFAMPGRDIMYSTRVEFPTAPYAAPWKTLATQFNT